MTRPARRGKGALNAIIGTVLDVIRLPFRVIGNLFGRRGPRR